jgi:hypothetical protein
MLRVRKGKVSVQACHVVSRLSLKPVSVREIAYLRSHGLHLQCANRSITNVPRIRGGIRFRTSATTNTPKPSPGFFEKLTKIAPGVITAGSVMFVGFELADVLGKVSEAIPVNMFFSLGHACTLWYAHTSSVHARTCAHAHAQMHTLHITNTPPAQSCALRVFSGYAHSTRCRSSKIPWQSNQWCPCGN